MKNVFHDVARNIGTFFTPSSATILLTRHDILNFVQTPDNRVSAEFAVENNQDVANSLINASVYFINHFESYGKIGRQENTYIAALSDLISRLETTDDKTGSIEISRKTIAELVNNRHVLHEVVNSIDAVFFAPPSHLEQAEIEAIKSLTRGINHVGRLNKIAEFANPAYEDDIEYMLPPLPASEPRQETLDRLHHNLSLLGATQATGISIQLEPAL